MNEDLKEIAFLLKLSSTEDLKDMESEMQKRRDACRPSDNRSSEWVKACQILKVLQAEIGRRQGGGRS